MKKTSKYTELCLFLFLICLTICESSWGSAISKKHFGKLPDGRVVDIYTLTNQNGMKVQIMNFGAAITSVVVPDRDGHFADIALGFDNFNQYLCDNPYLGGIVGRYGNRIANGRFKIDGVEYVLNTNNNGQHLHGGIKGFDRVLWEARSFKNDNGVGVTLNYFSKDGEENYPGNVSATVTYTLNNKNEIKIDYLVTTDKATPVNLTQHGYWNLAGQGNGTILDHIMQINADSYIPTDSVAIPTGEITPVTGTPMDFTKPKAIGKNINDDFVQLKYGKGYDHNWVLNNDGNEIRFACSVYDPKSGRELKIYTTEPGMQFYSGNFLNGSIIGKDGKKYEYRSAMVLETQHFPDSPNHSNFPSTILQPGKPYISHTTYQFCTRN